MTTTRDTLIAARALIAEPGRWTQGATARRAADNTSTGASSPDSARWCMRGAIQAANRGTWINENAAVERLCDVLGDPESLADWNDAPERRHEDVLAAFDKAIAALDATGDAR